MIRRSPFIALGSALLVACLVLCAAASAGGGRRAGNLDRSFGADGYLVRDFGPEPGSGGAEQVILQPDGRALVRTSRNSVARFLPDGTLDTSFGEGGYLTHVHAARMDLAADGKILIGGWVSVHGSLSEERAVSRFLPDGQPDPTFGDGGIVRFDPAGQIGEFPERVIALPDGGALVVVFGKVGEAARIEVTKLLANGTPDPGYGHAGLATLPLPASEQYPEHPGIALAGERLTLVVSGGQAGLFIAWLTAGGSPDPSLGGSGTATAKNMEGGSYNLAVEPDGRFLVANNSGGIARYLSDGSADTSFGEGGFLVVPILQKTTKVNALALEPDGKILLGGYLEAQPAWKPQDFRLARLMPDGTPDPTFGDGGSGLVTTDIEGGSEDAGRGLARLPGGEALLVGGTMPAGANSSRERIAMARYTASGQLDPGFGVGGIAIHRPMVRSQDRVGELAADAEGRLLVTGRAAGRVLLARYTRAGQPDPAFGDGGVVTTAPNDTYDGEEGDSLARYPGGRTLVGTGPVDAALLMFLPDGHPDPGFGEAGVVHSPALDRITDIAVTAGGGILAAGYSYEPCGAYIEAHLPDGGLRRSFGNEGVVTVDDSIAGVCRGRNLHLALRHDGNFLVAGETNFRILSEFTADGELRPGFAKARATRRALPRKITALAVDGRERVVLGGTLHRGVGLVRLSRRGTVDRGFGRHGAAFRTIGKKSLVSDLRLEAGGRIVVAARAYPSRPGVSWETIPVVARFTSDGRPDRAFGKNGAWVGPPVAALSSVALGRNSILAGGWTLGEGAADDLVVLSVRR